MLGMAEDAKQPHIAHMKKSPRVTFKMLRIAEDDWQIGCDVATGDCPSFAYGLCAGPDIGPLDRNVVDLAEGG